jgi:hypothetical protein
LLDATLPPKPVPTRWDTWIETVNFCSEHFKTVKSVVTKFPFESAVLVHESQSAFSDPKVACSNAYIQNNLGWLPENIKRLETQGLPLQISTDIMKNASENLSVVKWRLVKLCPPS